MEGISVFSNSPTNHEEKRNLNDQRTCDTNAKEKSFKPVRAVRF